MSDEKNDEITNAVKSLGMMTHPIDEAALREVKWPQMLRLIECVTTYLHPLSAMLSW